MIYVRVELWPVGNRAAARVLGEAVVFNDGTGGNGPVGNYGVALSKKGGFGNGSRLEAAQLTNVWRKGAVRGFPRLRLGSWDLLLRALRSLVGARNEDESEALE
jgi:hypothetical protein